MAKKTHNMEKRGTVWYFRKTFKGRTYHLRLSSNRTKAMKMRDDYLYELRHYGELHSYKAEAVPNEKQIAFGEVALLWSKMRQADIRQKQLKESSWRDYRSIMNYHILAYFGNMVISEIAVSDVEDFIATLECSPKRINNVLILLRSLFKMAKKRKLITENIMLEVENLKTEQPDIFPLTKEEVRDFLRAVEPHYRPFFTVAFATGMRFGEMAALKWRNVDFDRRQIHIRKSRVYGVEGSPKTKKSKRTIDMLPPALKALQEQRLNTGRDIYVFRDTKGRFMVPDHIRNQVWKPAIAKAELEYRPMIQTRHTFATIAIDSGEDLGWVQQMMGHSSLQMIYTRYYGWVKKSTRNDGSAFTTSFEIDAPDGGEEVKHATRVIKFVPKAYQEKKKGLTSFPVSP